jgi:hypothetical protein
VDQPSEGLDDITAAVRPDAGYFTRGAGREAGSAWLTAVDCGLPMIMISTRRF